MAAEKTIESLWSSEILFFEYLNNFNGLASEARPFALFVQKSVFNRCNQSSINILFSAVNEKAMKKIKNFWFFAISCSTQNAGSKKQNNRECKKFKLKSLIGRIFPARFSVFSKLNNFIQNLHLWYQNQLHSNPRKIRR